MTLQIVRAPAVTEALVEQDETQCDAPAATTQASEVLTRSEAARLLRVSIATLNRLRDIPRHRVGCVPRYLRSELMTWLAAQGSK
jgi:hypothetical protein